MLFGLKKEKHAFLLFQPLYLSRFYLVEWIFRTSSSEQRSILVSNVRYRET